MAKTLLRSKAIKLRLQGYTYSQIKKELSLQKSTLSDWLKNLSLTEDQLHELSLNKKRAEELRVEKYRITRQSQRLTRLKNVYQKEKSDLLPLTKKELFLLGLFLYWGEGEKKHGRLSVSNTDPRIIEFTLYWMTQILDIPKEKLKVQLHLYKDMDIEESISFWSNLLKIPKMQFSKPYIKSSNREGLTYKGFGHGTCKLYYVNVATSEKIAMSIKAISDFYGAKDDIFWYN